MLLGVSDVVWQALIGAFVTVILAYMQQRTKNAVEKTAKDAAKQAIEVKAELTQANSEKIQKLTDVATAVEQVHLATNSLTDRLVKTTEQEALQRGADVERARADAEKRV